MWARLRRRDRSGRTPHCGDLDDVADNRNLHQAADESHADLADS